MKFTKMHGCGNDYVYVNCCEKMIDDPEEVSRFVSDRHFGVGGDGMILICPSEVADFRMRMFNLDGSEGKMCGNGIRCVSKFVYDHGMTDKKRITIETLAGIKTLDLTVEDDKVTWVTVDMGSPIVKPEQVPVKLGDGRLEQIVDYPVTVLGKEYRITCVSMGNPHAVIFVDEDVKDLDLEAIGPHFEHNEIFPEGVNTEFVHVKSRTEVDMRVWERGSGETLACGTGSCAVLYACILNGLTEDEATIHLLGGDLKDRYDRERHTIFMTGPATTVFEGEIELPKQK